MKPFDRSRNMKRALGILAGCILADSFSFQGDRLQWKFPANSLAVLRLAGK